MAVARVYRIVEIGLVILATGAAHCARRGATEGTPAPTSAVSAAPSPVPPPTVAPAPEATARGPRADLVGEHYVLSAVLTAPPAMPGGTSLTVEVRGADGYHINDLYPVALELQASGATAPAQLRRADAAEVSQHRAAFRVPVRVTDAGAEVHGTARFAVCSAQNCVPHEQAFAVNLP
jgi:hypothetical protein